MVEHAREGRDDKLLDVVLLVEVQRAFAVGAVRNMPKVALE